MSELPASGYLSNSARTEGEMKTGFEDQRDAVAQIVGAGVTVQDLTIDASGNITPGDGLSCVIAVTEYTGTADDLDNIVVSSDNIVDGQFILLMRDSGSSATISVRHQQGGTYKINTTDAASFDLDADDKWILLRLDGNETYEVMRSYGDQTTQEPAFQTFYGFGDACTKTVGASSTNVPLVSDILGKQTIWVPVEAMTPQTTDGCGVLTNTEITANKPEFQSMAFADGTVVQKAQFRVKFPKSWDTNAVECRVFWTANDTSTNSVLWQMEAISVADGEVISSGTWPSADTVTDANGGTSAYKLNIASFITTIDPAGAADGELVFFRISRDPTDTNDTLAASALLIGVEITYTISALNDD